MESCSGQKRNSLGENRKFKFTFRMTKIWGRLSPPPEGPFTINPYNQPTECKKKNFYFANKLSYCSLPITLIFHFLYKAIMDPMLHLANITTQSGSINSTILRQTKNNLKNSPFVQIFWTLIHSPKRHLNLSNLNMQGATDFSSCFLNSIFRKRTRPSSLASLRTSPPPFTAINYSRFG